MMEVLIGALSIGIFSFLWAFVSGKLALIAWVGFVGCTSYYAAGKNFRDSLLTNLTGVFWAMVIITINSHVHFPESLSILIGIFSFVMWYQSRCKLLAFIPGTFLGACSTFGTEGNYKMVLICLICGAIIGYLSDKCGQLVIKKCS